MKVENRNGGEHFLIRPAKEQDWDDAMELALRTFLRFESEEYGQEGTDHFIEFLSDKVLKNLFLKGEYLLFVAQMGQQLIGLISLRSGNHISLLFVDEKFHRKGVATALVRFLQDYMLANTIYEKVTVNAAPYGLPFYRRIGFVETGSVTTKDGITYTPMEFYL